MKVLIVAHTKDGKFSPFVQEQALALSEVGCSVGYFGIEGHSVMGYLKNLSSLKRKISDFKPDIVHAHYGLSGLLATMQRKVPVVVTFHNGETLRWWVNFLSSLCAFRSKYVIYVAEHIRQLSYYKARKYSIIPCGVDLEDCSITDFESARKLLNFEDGKKYVLFGGAFDNLRKNYPLLREAVELMDDRDCVVCLEMKGLSRAECVLRMCACDVFALPSKSEGSPQALKEAMACNCPIVATDIADIRHLLGDMDGHFICNFDPKDLAEKIKAAFDFGDRTAGRERLVDLGLTNDAVARKLLDIYKMVI